MVLRRIEEGQILKYHCLAPSSNKHMIFIAGKAEAADSHIWHRGECSMITDALALLGEQAVPRLRSPVRHSSSTRLIWGIPAPYSKGICSPAAPNPRLPVQHCKSHLLPFLRETFPKPPLCTARGSGCNGGKRFWSTFHTLSQFLKDLACCCSYHHLLPALPRNPVVPTSGNWFMAWLNVGDSSPPCLLVSSIQLRSRSDDRFSVTEFLWLMWDGD